MLTVASLLLCEIVRSELSYGTLLVKKSLARKWIIRSVQCYTCYSVILY